MGDLKEQPAGFRVLRLERECGDEARGGALRLIFGDVVSGERCEAAAFAISGEFVDGPQAEWSGDQAGSDEF